MNRIFSLAYTKFVVIADPSAWNLSENVFGARQLKASGIEPFGQRAVLHPQSEFRAHLLRFR